MSHVHPFLLLAIGVNPAGFTESIFVMPAKAGIQEHAALVCGLASWIPGLATLARNDVATRSSFQRKLESGAYNRV
ncbi:MAG: hypothetical protein FJ147_19440 [Deltaproteobacteria bacterium]|nr:hypothetical protein [Deltaproteobacteria bacterium]